MMAHTQESTEALQASAHLMSQQSPETKAKWCIIEDTDMDSDHLPIVIEIRNQNIQSISTNRSFDIFHVAGLLNTAL